MLGAIRRFRGQWPTPETSPTSTICRVLLIPDDIRIMAAVDGALSFILNEDYWRDAGLSVEETVELLDNMFLSYIDSQGSCPVEIQEQNITAYHSVTSGTNGGSTVANAWTICPFNLVSRVNTSDGTLASNVLTLPAGLWRIRARHALFQSNGTSIAICGVRLKTHFGVITNAYNSIPLRSVASSQAIPEVDVTLNFIMPTELSLEYRTNVLWANAGLGAPLTQGSDELYGEISCSRVVLVTP